MARHVYTCHKCGMANPDWLTFETGWPKRTKYWCLHHIPWWTRLLMTLRRNG